MCRDGSPYIAITVGKFGGPYIASIMGRDEGI
jgi:hypothetical protein